MGYRRD